jgi:hypothetical protein
MFSPVFPDWSEILPVFSPTLINRFFHPLVSVITMGLSNKKEEQLRVMPIIRSSISKSKDGKYIVQRTTITNIKPVAYYEAVLNGKLAVVEENIEDELLQLAA